MSAVRAAHILITNRQLSAAERVLTPISLIFRVSTSYGHDSLPASAKRVQFFPRRNLGVEVGGALRSNAWRFVRAVDFFKLFFTAQLMNMICENTNKYAWMHILDRQTYAEKDGSWKNFTPDEVMQCIAILIYMGIVELPRLHLYWNTSELFSGLIPPKVMPRSRFFAFLAFLSVMDSEKTDPIRDGKLHRITHLLQHINDVSCQLFQPYRNLCVDERTVKSKERSGIRQYMRDKGVKWGYKLWVLADSRTGYTVQFNVYTGKRETPSSKGLAYDVVTRLCEPYLDQGYIIYLDNFYTSPSLFVHLLERKTLSCGTTRKDRRGFPSQLKDNTWEKRATRGDVRWLRCSGVLYLQWKDKRAVNMMSTAHTANNHVTATRKVKSGGQWTKIPIRKPLLIEEYNKGMLGVDKSDQLISSYNVLMKYVRWWKTLFFHCIDIAVVNSFILFQAHREEHPEIEELTRKTGFDQLAFRIELVNQILGMDDRHVHLPPPPKKSEHKPTVHEKRRNCKLCYEKQKVERKTGVSCEACGLYLCFIPTRDCFGEWHATHPC